MVRPPGDGGFHCPAPQYEVFRALWPNPVTLRPLRCPPVCIERSWYSFPQSLKRPARPAPNPLNYLVISPGPARHIVRAGASRSFIDEF